MTAFITKLLLIVTVSAFFSFESGLISRGTEEQELAIGNGIQPDVAIDANGRIHIVYGNKNGNERELYTVSSQDGGKTFSKPNLLGTFPQMGLGMARGPQIVATKDYTVVTLGDHNGNMFSLRSPNGSVTWSKPVKINDADMTAKEALSGLTATNENEVYTIWLDTRLGNNNLFGAISKDGGLTWEKNQLIYEGEEGGICDCCKPSVIADGKGKINVMFRNKLRGARNMYLISSVDHGQHFGRPQKLGTGDFMINGCPMDGGDLAADDQGNVTTVWRRQMELFLSQPGKPELKLGNGRTPIILQTAKGPVIAWEQDAKIQFLLPGGKKPVSLGSGQYPKLALLASNKGICVFERDGQIVIQPLTI
ncbi:sialidase family protein [Dyadobacter jiangsuensis]